MCLIVLAVVGALNFSGEPLQQDLRHHQQQAVHALRSDPEARQEPETGREAYRIGISPRVFKRRTICWDRYKDLSPKIEVKYQDLEKNITQARAAGVTRARCRAGPDRREDPRKPRVFPKKKSPARWYVP